MIVDVPYVMAQAPACATITMTQALQQAGSPLKFFEGEDAKKFVRAYLRIRGIEDDMERPETGLSVHFKNDRVLIIGWVNECAVGAGVISIEDLERILVIVTGRGV